MIERLEKVKNAQIKHHPGIQGAKFLIEELWLNTRIAKAGLQDAKLIIEEFINSANKIIEEINKGLSKHI